MFCYYGAKYTLMSYLVIFFTSFGLDPQQAGVIASVRSAVQVIGSIVIGWLVDYTRRCKLILLSAIFLAALSVLVMPFAGNVISSSNALKKDNTSVNATSEILNSNGDKNLKLFWTFLSCCFVYAFSDGIHGMVDATIMKLTHIKGKGKSTYSHQRLWGSIGYGFVPLVAGLVLEQWHSKGFIPVLYLFVALHGILMVSCYIMLKGNSYDTEQNEGTDSKGNQKVWKHLWTSIKQMDTVVIMINSFLNGVAGVIQFGFVYLLIQEEMFNASKTIMGFSFLASSLTEAMVAPFIGKMSKCLGSPYASMALSLIGYGLTFLLYHFTKNAILVLPINLIAGITYPGFIYSAQDELYRLTHPSSLTVMFTIDRSVYSGIGGGMAGVVGGSLFKQYGGRVMYLIFAVMYFVSAVLTYAYGYCRNDNKKPVWITNRFKDCDNEEKLISKTETMI